ncbi:MAG: pyridoxamine 5'-phosphate oxidase family protein [Pseudomonadota bacterium]
MARWSRTVATQEELALLYGSVAPASLHKEVPAIAPCYRALIEASPFCVLATSGPGGLDASPRGDAPGFVVVEDERTLLLPDRRGNNRLDSLHNIVSDPRVALLFLIPGRGETLRVNGRAEIVLDAALLARFAVQGKAPACVLAVTVESVFFQCARALLRSRLWDPEAIARDRALPSAGQMLAALAEGGFDGDAYDLALPARQRSTLY